MKVLLLLPYILYIQADSHAAPAPTPEPEPEPAPDTAITMEGDTAILDWAKCCDCEENPVKPMGKPCEVTITTAHKLKLKYSNSKYHHNIIQVPSQADFDTCKVPESE